MVQLWNLPALPNAGTQIGGALGAGLAQGIPQGIQNHQAQQAENQRQDRLGQILAASSPRGLGGGGQTGAPGGGLSNEQLNALYVEDPQLASFIQKQQEQANVAQAKKQTALLKLNEPKLVELGNKLQSYELEGIRFERLNELFNEEADKMPSHVTAALFSKDGQINDKAAAFLSAPAQEAIKLITDLTSGIKDTYGARVTNFDLQTYLKKLPSLLNKPEGRKRILHDLQLINKLNMMHTGGILDEFQANGGAGAIPYSQAESMFRERHKDTIADLKKQFVTGRQPSLKELPPAAQHAGKKIKDLETGKILISNGTEWVPASE